MKLAVVPARAHSKRLKDKNLRKLHGRSLLARIADVAPLFDAIVVSTDSARIADEAQSLGWGIFWRNAALAGDHACSIDVWKEVLDHYTCDMTALLEPTSPMRTVEDIERTLDAAWRCGAAMTVQRGQIPEKALRPDAHMMADISWPIRTRHEDAFWRNGACYAGRPDAVKAGFSRAYLVETGYRCNIDSALDLKLAGHLLEV